MAVGPQRIAGPNPPAASLASKTAATDRPSPRWNTEGVDLVIDSHGRQASASQTTEVDMAAALELMQSDRAEPDAAISIGSETTVPPRLPARWLRSTSSSAAAEVARRLLNQASTEFNVGAWLSAETTAWSGLRHAAEAVDLADRENSQAGSGSTAAMAKLQFAKLAIREARDFSGTYGALDADAIARMAKSHRTDVLDGESVEGLSATDASDRYLDAARVELAAIAARSVEAAQALDLLAAIYLSRADSKTLPSATALCLRRAALQGQPGNASLASRLGMHLADVGLYDEARWALEHSLSIEPDPEATETLVNVLRRSGHGEDAARMIASMQDHTQGDLEGNIGSAAERRRQPHPKIPEITELSPADFAALSQPVIPVSRRGKSADTSLASTKTNVAAAKPDVRESTGEHNDAAAPAKPVDGIHPVQKEKPGMVRRMINRFKPVW